MEIRERIISLASQPITHQLLVDILKDYKRPNDKIQSLKEEGIIEPLKKGLYIIGRTIKTSRVENGLIANHMLGPSYLSEDSALSFYGLIPEKVFAITSMTTKASRDFETSIGLFTYKRLPLPYYAFGLCSTELSKNQKVMIATPEKALCDKIITTSGIIFRSISAVEDYLLGNLRMEEAELKDFNREMMEGWLAHAPKKESLQMMIKMLAKL
jgi:hypothetical protein